MKNDFVKPLIVAHRGASTDAPENTLASFAKAFELGAEGIEFDVRFAKDGVPVVFHDAKLRRVGGKTGNISDYTSAELQTFDVGSWFNAKYPRKADERFAVETVPTLNGFFDYIKDYKGLIYVELKHAEAETAALARAVSRIITQTNLFPNVIVKSFNLEALREMRRLNPEIRTAALFAPNVSSIVHKEKQMLDKARAAEADEISMHCSLATQSFIAKAAERGFTTAIWTANSLVWVRRAFELGINSVITNNPAKLLAQKRKVLRSIEKMP